MSDATISKLIEMKEKLGKLEAVKCGIAHEKVLIDEQTNLPITTYTGEIVFERIGFCAPETRKKRISCSHTSAPYILQDALMLLEFEGADVEFLKKEFFDVTNQICQLDHKKGDAEADLAKLIAKKQTEPNQQTETEIASANREIKKIENEHAESVDKIAKLRDRIILEIEKAI